MNFYLPNSSINKLKSPTNTKKSHTTATKGDVSECRNKLINTKKRDKNLDRFPAPTIHCLPPYLRHHNNRVSGISHWQNLRRVS